MRIDVHLTCPSCDKTWLEAIIETEMWWGKHATPEAVANRCHCKYCQQEPPMNLKGHGEQGELFA